MAELTIVPPTPSPAGLLPQPSPPLAPPPPPQNKIRLTKRDSAVAALHRIGVSEEDIASRLRMTTLAVQKSLLKWFKQQMEGSTELVQIRVNEMALANLELVNTLIRDGLTATRAIKNDKDEIIGHEPDYSVRKQFAVLLKDWAQAVVPKTPLISQNINQNNQQNNFNGMRGRSFESLVRDAEERHKLEASQSPRTIDANDVEFEEDSPLEEEEVEGDEPELDDADNIDEDE